MSTIDKFITSDWTLIATASESFEVTLQGDAVVALVFADAEPAADLRGHILDAKHRGAQGYRRESLAPPGAAYMKSLSPGSVVVGLTTWTE